MGGARATPRLRSSERTSEMKLSLSSMLPGAVVRMARGTGGLAMRVRAWVWGNVVARLLAAGGALVLFAAIGSSAFAHDHAVDGSLLTTTSTLGPVGPAPSPSLPSPIPPAPDPAAWVDAQAPPATACVPPAAEGNAGTMHASSRARASPEDPVILNAATLADLQRLPGIGEKRAEAVLSVRARLGRFHQIEDLLKVKGIGRATLKKLRPLVRIDPPAADAGANP
jgi:competence protein ComEA